MTSVSLPWRGRSRSGTSVGKLVAYYHHQGELNKVEGTDGYRGSVAKNRSHFKVTDGPTDRWTDGPMDRPTDPHSKLYRVSATEITEKGLELTSK